MAVEWFCQMRGKVLGPFNPDQLRALVREGRITEETSVRKGREGDWVPAGRVRRLFEEPVPTENPSDVRQAIEPTSTPNVTEEDAYALISVAESPAQPGMPDAVPALAPKTLPPSNPAGENVLLEENGIMVTDRRLAFGGSVCYATQHVVSIRRGSTPRTSPWPWLAAISGSILFFLGIVSMDPDGGRVATGVVLIIFGLAVLGAGIVGLSRRKSDPWVLISFSSGESRQVNHPDPAFLDRVWTALNWTIVGHP